jgi:general secretion pathway protein B
MSFILDALKKSENDRQRSTGPALFEVRVAPPRSRFPLWAIAVGVLLMVNLGVVAWLVLRTNTQTAVAQTPVPTPAPSAPTPAAPPAPALAAPASVTFSRNTDEQTVEQAVPGEAPSDEGFVNDDYAPAEEPALDDRPAPTVERGSVSGLPTYEKANQQAGGRIPELRMDMHVYAPKPQDRFVFVNMRKLKEGETLPEGVRVESITNDGVIFSYQGSKFTLERE